MRVRCAPRAELWLGLGLRLGRRLLLLAEEGRGGAPQQLRPTQASHPWVVGHDGARALCRVPEALPEGHPPHRVAQTKAVCAIVPTVACGPAVRFRLQQTQTSRQILCTHYTQL